ncbi:MAG: hypothetical protein IT328_20135 [Caldilineaceae bacterium]|nr:hypothetical protein [Caldilineaceae bacterium]
MQQVQVRSKLGAGRVALWEKHPAHPEGEVFVVGQVPATVALTQFVYKRIADGFVEVVPEVKPAESEQTEPPTPTAPWEGYEEATVDEVLERLAEADEATRAAVLAYEQAGKARKGVLEALKPKE